MPETGDGLIVCVAECDLEVRDIPQKSLPKRDVPFVQEKRLRPISTTCLNVFVKWWSTKPIIDLFV